MANTRDTATVEIQPRWTHPVLPDGSLGPTRAVLGRFSVPSTIPSQPISHQLTEFPLFPKLPLDLRIYIWRLAVDFERVVRVYEQIEEKDSDSEESDADEDEEDEEDEDEDISWDVDPAVYPTTVENRGFWTNNGQNQLEDYGFTSSHPKPELPSNSEQTYTKNLLWETTRVGEFCPTGPMPVLLHVCRESRQLLQSYGYALAFSTRTASAKIWFNFQYDILDLHQAREPEDASPILDGGMWNLGQFSRQDLDRVRKLSLSINHYEFNYGGSVPDALHKAVQFCGNLKELLLVEIDEDRGDIDSRNAYWHARDSDADVEVVDLAVEELWGHCPGWQPGARNRYDVWYHYNAFNRRPSARDFVRLETSYTDIAQDLEEKFRCQKPFFPDRKEWTTPKVRFVMLAARHKVPKFIDSRESYKRYIDNMYWMKVAESRKRYRAPGPSSPTHVTDGMDVLHEQWMDESQGDYYGSPEIGWYKDAREAI